MIGPVRPRGSAYRIDDLNMRPVASTTMTPAAVAALTAATSRGSISSRSLTSVPSRSMASSRMRTLALDGERFRVDQVGWGLPVDRRDQVLRRGLGHGRARRYRRAAQVRSQHG